MFWTLKLFIVDSIVLLPFRKWYKDQRARSVLVSQRCRNLLLHSISSMFIIINNINNNNAPHQNWDSLKVCVFEVNYTDIGWIMAHGSWLILMFAIWYKKVGYKDTHRLYYNDDKAECIALLWVSTQSVVCRYVYSVYTICIKSPPWYNAITSLTSILLYKMRKVK